MLQKVRQSLSGVEVSMMLATLAARGLGFLMLLFVSRASGTIALGTYSVLVNTVAAVAAPFAQVILNNATVLGAEGARRDVESYRALATASNLLAILLSVIAVPAFLVLYSLVTPTNIWLPLGLTAIGAVLVLAQLLGAVSLGFLYGAGEFKFSSRVSLAVALAGCLGAYPLIQTYGLGGAVGLLLATSLLLPALLAARVASKSPSSPRSKVAIADAWKDVRRRLFRNLPSLAATAIGNGVNWSCTVYLVQESFGVGAAGTMAVAGQWLNLMLLPVTSWGGVALKTLSDAAALRDGPVTWRAATGLVRKNFGVTLTVAIVIAAASPLLAYIYKLTETDVVLLICVYAVSAVFWSVNNVFERLSIALDRQVWWLKVTILGSSVQLLLVGLFVQHGLWVVALGALLAAVIVCALSYYTGFRSLHLPR